MFYNYPALSKAAECNCGDCANCRAKAGSKDNMRVQDSNPKKVPVKDYEITGEDAWKGVPNVKTSTKKAMLRKQAAPSITEMQVDPTTGKRVPRPQQQALELSNVGDLFGAGGLGTILSRPPTGNPISRGGTSDVPAGPPLPGFQADEVNRFDFSPFPGHVAGPEPPPASVDYSDKLKMPELNFLNKVKLQSGNTGQLIADKLGLGDRFSGLSPNMQTLATLLAGAGGIGALGLGGYGAYKGVQGLSRLFGGKEEEEKQPELKMASYTSKPKKNKTAKTKRKGSQMSSYNKTAEISPAQQQQLQQLISENPSSPIMKIIQGARPGAGRSGTPYANQPAGQSDLANLNAPASAGFDNVRGAGTPYANQPAGQSDLANLNAPASAGFDNVRGQKRWSLPPAPSALDKLTGGLSNAASQGAGYSRQAGQFLADKLNLGDQFKSLSPGMQAGIPLAATGGLALGAYGLKSLFGGNAEEKEKTARYIANNYPAKRASFNQGGDVVLPPEPSMLSKLTRGLSGAASDSGQFLADKLNLGDQFKSLSPGMQAGIPLVAGGLGLGAGALGLKHLFGGTEEEKEKTASYIANNYPAKRASFNQGGDVVLPPNLQPGMLSKLLGTVGGVAGAGALGVGAAGVGLGGYGLYDHFFGGKEEEQEQEQEKEKIAAAQYLLSSVSTLIR